MKDIPHILSLDKVLKNKADQFFMDHFSRAKAQFLIDQGEWLCKGNENRFALISDGNIIGYFGVIPTSINKLDVKSDALWWIDLVINKKYRGLGYQSIVDQYIRNRPGIKLGIPNKFAAKIHTKHKWSVRQDPRIFLYPISPINSLSKKDFFSKYGIISRSLIYILIPLIKFINYWLKKYQIKWSEEIINPSPKIFQDVFFDNFDKKVITTWRDIEFFNYRYLLSPNKNQFRYFISKKADSVSHYCIIRTILKSDEKYIRILDLFGNLDDHERIVDILNNVVKVAIDMKAVQITAFSTSKRLSKVYRKCGFLISKKSRFCYYDNNLKHSSELKSNIYFTLGDSDNDDQA